MDLRPANHENTSENIALLLETNSRLAKENAHLKQRLEESEQKITWLVEQMRLGQQRQFAAKNESSEQLQLSLFDDTETVTNKEGQPATETITYSRQKKAVGRRIDTSKLPREVVVHDLATDAKCCKQCGTPLETVGEDRAEQLEYIPAQIKVIEHVCKKYTCRHCETLVTADKPEMPLAKSMAAPSLIAEVIIKKYEHHLPWYRQSKIFTQDGIDIPANTIGNWFMQAGEVLLPLKGAYKEQLSNTNILQADETPVKVLQDNVRGYMWAYHSCKPENRFIIFEYNDSRSGKVASNELENYQGILQSDGYSGYNALRSKSGIISLGCWAHCRRHFADVVKLSHIAGKAHEILKWIAKLYQIENEAKDQKLDFVARQRLRQEQSPPILEKIHELLTNATSPPKSALGKAITYALNQWEYLTKYINHGEAEIDNNLVENQIRPFALGRKNWLFVGNEKAANTAAFFYSLIQTCRMNNVDPRKYLIYVLGQAHKMRRAEVSPQTLLPQFIDRALLV